MDQSCCRYPSKCGKPRIDFRRHYWNQYRGKGDRNCSRLFYFFYLLSLPVLVFVPTSELHHPLVLVGWFQHWPSKRQVVWPVFASRWSSDVHGSRSTVPRNLWFRVAPWTPWFEASCSSNSSRPHHLLSGWMGNPWRAQRFLSSHLQPLCMWDLAWGRTIHTGLHIGRWWLPILRTSPKTKRDLECRFLVH